MLSSEMLGVDIAALRTLRLVFRLKSFSEAAGELDLNQSTVSYTIDRLRKALNDPLFVRQGGGIAPTDRCREAVEVAELILSEVEQLNADAEFEPGRATDTVTISSNYYARMTFLGDVVRRIRQEAPGLTLRLTSGFRVGPSLLNGETDIAISPVPQEVKGVYQQVLTEDPVVCMMDKLNPLTQGTMNFDDYCAAKHVFVDFGGQMKTVMQREVEAQGRSINKVVTIPDPASLPNLIQGTDLIATIPGRFAKLFGGELAVRSAPTAWPTAISMFWPARSHRAPLNVWLREVIAGAAAEMEPTIRL